MGETKFDKTFIVLSFLLALFVIIVSSYGLFVHNAYSRETLNWVTQAYGQDIVDLFLVTPTLIVTSILAFRKSKIALIMLAGCLLYLIYTFMIYCFDLHFNRMFILYCWILGLSFYLFLYFLFMAVKEPAGEWIKNKIPIKSTGAFILICGIFFYFLWLSSIVPAIIKNTVPVEITEIGMPTNPVHVLDLSIILPGLIITAILLLKKKPLGYMLAPVILTFFILMNIAIGILNIFLKMKGIADDYSVTIIMGVLTVVSLVFLLVFVRSVKSG